MYSASSSHSRRPPYPSSSDQSLVDEVAYLHSLWRQGPPAKRRRGENPPAQSTKKPRPEQPPTQEKKKNKKKRKKNKKKREEEQEKPQEEQEKPEESRVPIDENWNPDSQWDTQNPSVSKEWASEASKTEVKPLTEEEQLQFGKLKVQQKAARVFREFLIKGREDESLPTSSEDDDDVDEEEDGDGENGAKGGRPYGALAKELDAQKAFEKMFEEDEELRRFYEQNCNCGGFECLVCAAIGAKLGKKFPDCVSLIQHAMKILRTKKKAAHRGYGRAICCVLGWNIDRLPSVAKPPDSDFEPRACIPPPDEDEIQAPEEGDNGKETGSYGEDDNDAKEEMDSDGEKEASDDNDAKEEMDSDGEREALDDNDAKNDEDKEPALD